MATKDYPNISNPDSEEWTIRYNTQSFTSELNGISQTAELPGAKWKVSLSYGSRFGRDARILQGFLAGLRGSVGRFWYIPSDWEPLGNPSGAGRTSVSALGGAVTIQTNNWPASEPELFLSGDYFEINGELKKITSTVSTNGTGEATIEFAPPLRKDVSASTTIRYTEPRCFMKLADDSQASWSITSPIFYGFSVEFVEALDQ